MKSRVSYMDITEASEWIAGQLEKEGLRVSEGLVRRILDQESAFLVMVGLARPEDEHSPQSGHILREGHWVFNPSAEIKGDVETKSEVEEVEST